MPRKRDPTKQISRRSHHGCQRCRSQKIRCDESRPTCGSCKSRGYSNCSFSLPLKWETEYVGRAFGRAGVWSKAAGETKSSKQCSKSSASVLHYYLLEQTPVYPYGFLNTFKVDFEEQNDGEIVERSVERSEVLTTVHKSNQFFHGSRSFLVDASFESHIHPLFDPYQANLRSVDPHLISYFLHQICPLTVSSANYASESPFSSLIFPVALLSSPDLMHGLLGLAASHRARFDKAYRGAALTYSSKALHSVGESLSSKTPQEMSADQVILPLIMLLCQIDLIEGEGDGWVCHLRGARHLIFLRRQQQRLLVGQSNGSSSGLQLPESHLSMFAERFFAFYDVVGRTACGEEPIFGSDFWNAQANQVDSWMGCSPRLVSIISTITELSWRFNGRVPSSEERQELENQRTRLDSLLQQPQMSLHRGSRLEDDIILHDCVELKRLTVRLYLNAALSETTPFTPIIKQSVREILRLTASLLERGVRSGLTWPLFMAACQLDPNDELEWTTDAGLDKDVPNYARPFVLYALDQLRASLSNVARTRSVVEKIWRKRESAHQPSRRITGSSDAFNDWARFVAPLCHNISLA